MKPDPWCICKSMDQLSEAMRKTEEKMKAFCADADFRGDN